MDLINKDKIAAVILAGGKGTRMNSDTPKVLNKLGDKPMIFYTLEKLQRLGIKDIYVVVGYKAEEVRREISKYFNCHFAYQAEPKGTADAVGTALPFIQTDIDHILVVNGDDSAFYSLNTLTSFMNTHLTNKAVISLITLELNKENRLGKIIRNKEGKFEKILEADEYLASGFQSNEVNCGAYLFDLFWIRENINNVPVSQKGEFYITELLNIAKNQGKTINLFALTNQNEWVGINTPEELQYAQSLMKERKLND